VLLSSERISLSAELSRRLIIVNLCRVLLPMYAGGMVHADVLSGVCRSSFIGNNGREFATKNWNFGDGLYQTETELRAPNSALTLLCELSPVGLLGVGDLELCGASVRRVRLFRRGSLSPGAAYTTDCTGYYWRHSGSVTFSGITPAGLQQVNVFMPSVGAAINF